MLGHTGDRQSLLGEALESSSPTGPVGLSAPHSPSRPRYVTHRRLSPGDLGATDHGRHGEAQRRDFAEVVQQETRARNRMVGATQSKSSNISRVPVGTKTDHETSRLGDGFQFSPSQASAPDTASGKSGESMSTSSLGDTGQKSYLSTGDGYTSSSYTSDIELVQLYKAADAASQLRGVSGKYPQRFFWLSLILTRFWTRI